MYTSEKLLYLAGEFEKFATSLKKKKKHSELEQLKMQLLDAKRQGDSEWVKELSDRIKELQNNY